MTAKKRKCPHCGKLITLTKDGSFRKHKGQWPIEICEMSWRVAF